MAEMETFILTAAHDADKLIEPILMDVSHEGEILKLMSGGSKAIHEGDMIMRDSQGISCSIIYGQDDRSPISGNTTHAFFVSYAPPGVSPETVTAQLEAIERNVRMFSPMAVLEQRQLISSK